MLEFFRISTRKVSCESTFFSRFEYFSLKNGKKNVWKKGAHFKSMREMYSQPENIIEIGVISGLGKSIHDYVNLQTLG